MADRKQKFVGRKNELTQFAQLISQRGFQTSSRVILIQGMNGIGKTTLARTCLLQAKKVLWQTAEVNWEQNLPRTPEELLFILTDALSKIADERLLLSIDRRIKRTRILQSTVNQYQQDHPEIWQQMLHLNSTVSDPQNTPQPSIILRADEGARQRLVAYMTRTNQLPKGVNEKIALDPPGYIANTVIDTLIKTAGKRGLIFWFDACEQLSPSLKNFLRDAFICPTIKKNARIHFILSGSSDQFHEHSLVDALGNTYRIKGYGDRLYDPPPIVWNLQHWVDPEITEYLKTHRLDSDPNDTAMLKESSNGMPLAVELVIDVQQQRSEESAAFSEQVFDTDNVNIVSTKVVRSFIKSYVDPTEKKILLALALLRAPDKSALSAMCAMDEGETPDPEPIIQKLSSAYHFLETDGRLHRVVQTQLRTYLSKDAQKQAQFLGQSASSYYQTQILKYDTQKIEERLRDENYQEILKNLLNALFWFDYQNAVELLVQSVLESYIFYPLFGKQLLQLASEFRHVQSSWSIDTIELFDTLARTYGPDIKDRLIAFHLIDEKDESVHLSDIHSTVLNILMAELYTINNQPEKAIALCDAVSEKELNDQSLQRELARAYGNAGTALSFTTGVAVASPQALHAYQNATKLDPKSAPYHYGLGVVLLASNRLEQAISVLNQAVILNPKHGNTAFARGLALSQLGKQNEAIENFSQTLSLNPKHAEAFYNRGLTYSRLGKHHQAQTDFSQAITLNPSMSEAYTKRGGLFTDQGQYKKALTDFERALKLNPTIAEVYARRGETYVKMEQYKDALTDFIQTLALNPQQPAVYILRGSTNAHLDQHQLAVIDFNHALELDDSIATVYVQRGDAHTALGEREKALVDYSQALTLDTSIAEAYVKRGNIYSESGQHKKALDDFDQALKLNPKLAGALIGRARMNIALGKYENALEDFDAALAVNPVLEDYKSQRGLAYLHLQQYENALKDLSQAVEDNPEDPDVLYRRGLAHYNLEQYDLALADFRQVLVINPNLVDVYVHRANTHAKLGNLDQAQIDYGQAIAVDPRSAFSFYSRGTIYVELGQYKEALADLNQAININPKMAEAHNSRGLCYTNLQLFDNALVDFAKAIELNPRDASVYNNRGNTYAELSKFDEALVDYTKAITLAPTMADTFYNRANILISHGQFNNALTDYTQAISLNPDMAEAYYARGNTFAKLGQLEDALLDFDWVLEKNPNDTATLNNRGNIHADMGHPELALDDYEEALRVNPQLAEVYTNRGLTYADLGQFDEALADYRQSLAIDSNDANAIYYSACAFALLKDEPQACAWLTQAVLLDTSFREMAKSDPDFDEVRNAQCFRKLMSGEN